MQELWNFCARRWTEIVFAIFFAAVFAVIFEFLRPDSPFRRVVRHVKNRLAGRSVERLRMRIGELERHRDIVNLYLASDRALYLHTLGIVLGVLLCISMGEIAIEMSRLGLIPGGEILSIGTFAIAIVLGVYGLRLASLDTRPKVSELIEKLNDEIAGLKAKLQERTQ